MDTPPPPASPVTARFSDRVSDYVRCRPGYPPGVMRFLAGEHGLAPDHVVADVGSGTGIWTEALLQHGCTVIGVEPNEPMRAAAERRFAGDPRFRSAAGSAEATGLPARSVDWITAAQAFHWFDIDRCRDEFRRVLRAPHHGVALIWNNRREDTPFLQAYEHMLRTFGTDYSAVKHQRIESDGSLERFFGGRAFAVAAFHHQQDFDYAGLEGRTLSASYTPREADPRRAVLLRALRAVFDQHARDGRVEMRYETRVYVGGIA